MCTSTDLRSYCMLQARASACVPLPCSCSQLPQAIHQHTHLLTVLQDAEKRADAETRLRQECQENIKRIVVELNSTQTELSHAQLLLDGRQAQADSLAAAAERALRQNLEAELAQQQAKAAKQQAEVQPLQQNLDNASLELESCRAQLSTAQGARATAQKDAGILKRRLQVRTSSDPWLDKKLLAGTSLKAHLLLVLSCFQVSSCNCMSLRVDTL